MEELLILPKNNLKVKNAVLELQELSTDFNAKEKEYEAKREELQNVIKNYANSENEEEFAVKSNKGNFKVRIVKQRKIIWDIDALYRKLSRKVFNQIIDKKYSIKDYDGLVEYLKTCNVDPKKFQEFIYVDKTVNKKRMDDLGELGEINKEKIKDCYIIEENSGYVKITNLK